MAAYYKMDVKQVQQLAKLMQEMNHPEIEFTNDKMKDLESAFCVMKSKANEMDKFLASIMMTQAESNEA